MNTLDWVFIVIFALLGIRCMIKGFVAEILSVAAFFVGILAGLFLYKSVGQLFVGWGLAAKPELLPSILGFVAVFLVAFIVVKLVARLIEEGIEAAQLGGVDRALGLLLGLAEGLILVSFVIVAMNLLEPTLKPIFAGYSKLLDGSYFYKLILPIIGPKVAQAPQGIKLNLPDIQKPSPQGMKLNLPVIKKP
jgi:membrane protein required for colicin V production